MSAAVLPSSFAAPRLSARSWLAVATGLGCAVTACAGLYPQFDHGALRIVLAVTCLPFGAAVTAAALSARTGAGAVGRALFLSAVLGVASTVLPGLVIAGGDLHVYPIILMFGVFFGAPTGALYGVPIAILAGLAHRHHRAACHDGTDRAARTASVWLACIAVLAFAGGLAIAMTEAPRVAGDLDIARAIAPLVPAAVAFALAVMVGARAHLRLARRAAWLDLVRSGAEPTFRVRVPGPRDDVSDLPRLGDGESVIEWCPEGHHETSAYRRPAEGIAVALVSDAP